MKKRDLAGVDPFEKWRLPNPYPSAMPEVCNKSSFFLVMMPFTSCL